MKLRNLITIAILTLAPLLEGALFAVAIHSGSKLEVLMTGAVILMVFIGMGKSYYIGQVVGNMARWKYLVSVIASGVMAGAVYLFLKHTPKETMMVVVMTTALCYLMAVMGKWCAKDDATKGYK